MDETNDSKFTRCIICGNFTIHKQCFNIFSTTLEEEGGKILLSDFLKRVLDCSVLIVVSPEFFICKRCFSLCSELNTTLGKCNQLQQKIQVLFQCRDDKQISTDYHDSMVPVKTEVVSEEDIIYLEETQEDLYCGPEIIIKEEDEHLQAPENNSTCDSWLNVTSDNIEQGESRTEDLPVELDLDEPEIVISQDCQPNEGENASIAAIQIIGQDENMTEEDGARSKVWLCKGCRMIFGSEECLEGHKNECTGEIKHIGIKSSVEFKNYTVKLKRKKRIYFCNHCSYETPKSTAMQEHIQAHKTDPPIMCDICGKRFKYRKTFKRHLELHDENRSFPCKQCAFRAKTSSHLQIHEKRHDEKNKHCCSICGYNTVSNVTLKIHMRIHTGERPYCCPDCPYKSKDKSTLMKHIRIHKGLKRYHCTICDYRAMQKNALKVHMLTHTGEKPHVCPHCDYASTVRHNLAAHIARKHCDEKPFKCTLCSYTTKVKRHLTYHARKHSDERPYTCNKCDYKAKYKSALIYHERSRHPIGGVLTAMTKCKLKPNLNHFQGESVELSDEYETESENEPSVITIKFV